MAAPMRHRDAACSFLLLALLVATPPAHAPGAAPAPPPAQARGAEPGTAPDTLALLIDRWIASVGARDRLAQRSGVYLRARVVTGGVPGERESWITREGLRSVLTEPADHCEWVRRETRAWWHDWNGRTHELQGRDRADAVTDAFLRALVHVGPSHEALARAQATDAGDDSTHTLRRVRLTPAGGVACELVLDRVSGRPARATRWPYADPVTIVFEDWRESDGVVTPFRIIDLDRHGDADTAWVTGITPLAASAMRRFTRPPDGPRDVRFEHGDRALGIPFDFGNDHLMVECRVNDSKPLWFLIDTGARYNVINRARLAELGLTSFGGTTIGGGGGTARLAFTHVARLAVGDVTLLGQREGVLDLSGLERLYGMPMGGILGMDFIDRFTMAVDYDHRTIDLCTPGRDAPVKRGTRVPFVIEEGHPHARGAIVVDDGPAIPTDWIIDTGAAESANLTSPFVREHRLLERARRTPAPAATSVPGTERQFYTQTTVRGRLREIRIGEVGVRDIPVNLQQGTTGAYASPSFSGTIGQRLLSHFNTTYDYANSAMYLAPNGATATPFPPRTTFGLSLVADGDDYTHFSVAGVRRDSPADSAGFRKGDVIASLDGRPARAWRLAGVRAALAEVGARRTAVVQRAGAIDTTLTFEVRVVSTED